VPTVSSRFTGDPSLLAFGAGIRRLRQQRDVSQEALALAAHIDRSYLGAVERGESNVTLVNMIKIAAALDVTVAELMMEARL
jgi:transcriptional regulator with XRE-family HTH domain